MDGSEVLDDDVAVGAYRSRDASLGSAVDIDVHRVARSEPIVLWCGDVHDGLEAQVFVREDVSSEYLMLVLALLVE